LRPSDGLAGAAALALGWSEAVMIRTSIAAALVYAIGLSFFDGYRPATLDEPLKTFASQINFATHYCWRKMPSLDVARTKQYVAAYIERAGAELRRSGHQPSR
jgi:hypothetical protein